VRFSGLCSLCRRRLRQPLCWRTRQERALLWPLFHWLARASPATEVAGTTGEGAVLFSVRSDGVGSDTLVAGTKVEGAALASVRSVDVSSGQSLWWWTRQVRVLHWPLFSRATWAQPATAVACTTGEGVALASVRSVGVGSASHCGGGHDR
jgi:hypothetical protein